MRLFAVAILAFLVGCSSHTIPQEYGKISVLFCPYDDCEQFFVDAINNASSVKCAFYDLDSVAVLDTLVQKKAIVVVDADNKIALLNDFDVVYDTRSAYMHNKFCVFDGKAILTGSTNPTDNGLAKNFNNMVYVESSSLANNFNAEFKSFLADDFGYDDHVEIPRILFNGFTVENYFCPEDNCEQHILQTLETANASIHFMTFSFTSDPIGDLILEKSKTLDVYGVFERTQKSKYSEFDKLIGLNVTYNTQGKVHHKAFIIDEKIVITGSMNPTKNGNVRNDENILIIHDTQIARLFLEEFERLH